MDLLKPPCLEVFVFSLYNIVVISWYKNYGFYQTNIKIMNIQCKEKPLCKEH